MIRTTTLAVAGFALSAIGSVAMAETARPNILMIMADDVGYYNVGAYSHGMVFPPRVSTDILSVSGWPKTFTMDSHARICGRSTSI